jgi:hypothetical protein
LYASRGAESTSKPDIEWTHRSGLALRHVGAEALRCQPVSLLGGELVGALEQVLVQQFLAVTGRGTELLQGSRGTFAIVRLGLQCSPHALARSGKLTVLSAQGGCGRPQHSHQAGPPVLGVHPAHTPGSRCTEAEKK